MLKEYGIHVSKNSIWKRKPVEVLKENRIRYEKYFYYDPETHKREGVLYVYTTDPITNLIIFNEIGVTDDCPVAEIEIPC